MNTFTFRGFVPYPNHQAKRRHQKRNLRNQCFYAIQGQKRTSNLLPVFSFTLIRSIFSAPETLVRRSFQAAGSASRILTLATRCAAMSRRIIHHRTAFLSRLTAAAGIVLGIFAALFVHTGLAPQTGFVFACCILFVFLSHDFPF
jgi:hypothetical protein